MDKTYRVSDQLVNIFLSNGFVDITEQTYPEHFKRLLQDGYDPQRIKRVLTVSSRDNVKFDYVTIVPYYKKTCNGEEMRIELTDSELRSIISFYKLPPGSRLALKRRRVSIPDLYKEYREIKSSPEIYKSKADKLLVETFEAVRLN